MEPPWIPVAHVVPVGKRGPADRNALKKSLKKPLILAAKLLVVAGLLAYLLSAVHWHDYAVTAAGQELPVLSVAEGPGGARIQVERDGVRTWLPAEGFRPISLTLDGRTAKRLRLTKRARTVTVATGKATVKARRTSTVQVRFTKRARQALRRARTVPLTVRVTVGGGAAETRRLTLKR